MARTEEERASLTNGDVTPVEGKTAVKKTASKAATKQTGPLVLERIQFEEVEIPIVGETELIVHQWSEKAKRMMLEKQMNPGARAKKEAKDPVADYESSLYRFEDGKRHGYPAAGFKAAIVGACRLFDGLPMTQAKIAIRVLGEGLQQLVEIHGTPRMREDMVRLETGVADIRFRAGFPSWHATLPIRFNSSLLTLQSLVNLVDAAGQGGVGEWRPSAPKSASGSYGTFRVKVEEVDL